MNLEKELVNLGYKVVKKYDDIKMDFESNIVSGFKLSGKSYLIDNKYFGTTIRLLIKNNESNDFEEYDTVFGKWKVENVEYMLMQLKWFIEDFYKYYETDENRAIKRKNEKEEFRKKITQLYSELRNHRKIL